MTYIPSINTSPFQRTPSGRVLTTASLAAVSTATLSVNIIYFTPIVVQEDQVFTGIQISPAVTTTTSYKVGLYKVNAGVSPFPTGLPITGTTGIIGPVTTAGVTAETLTWSSALTIPKGKYQIGIVADTTGTHNVCGSAAQALVSGAADATTSNGTRFTFSQAYTTGLTDMTGQTIVTNSGNNILFAGLVAQ